MGDNRSANQEPNGYDAMAAWPGRWSRNCANLLTGKVGISGKATANDATACDGYW